jgi:hypothetical protein
MEFLLLKTGIVSSPLHQILVGCNLGTGAGFDTLDTANDEGEFPKRLIHQPAEKRRDDVTALSGQVKTIPEFLHRDPPLIAPRFLHILLQ